ncbi:metallophosphoesterase family protein [Pontixanthobacter sp. CEM42]|uniref:metallophosphoesterase family protein n=1 Tax=Pontixanthobacter sp. CEM42 TaxID=2792077 RepID=UPI001ADFE253|nr:metallophosphoesterase family protein [Pontixanthobacter sp. CEM42]
MLKPILKIFNGKAKKKRACVPDGERLYVIGDIHGRLDLFDALVRAIEEDDKQSGEAETTIILLGDLVDRGPHSAGVIQLAQLWEEYRAIRYLFGNHEEMFLDSFDDLEVMRHFLKHGGRETILSYGVSEKQFNNSSTEELQNLMIDKVPKSDRKFLKSFEDMIIVGDYLFVHAGINPNRALDDQKPRELRWIRDKFLDHKDRHSHIVVHGHTITEEIEERKNRIGIDTGAYKFGTLTALVLEGDTRRYIQAVEKKKKGGAKIVHLQATDEG